MARLRGIGQTPPQRNNHPEKPVPHTLQDSSEEEDDDDVVLPARGRKAMHHRFAIHDDSDCDHEKSFVATTNRTRRSIKLGPLNDHSEPGRFTTKASPVKESLQRDASRRAALSPRKAAQQIAASRQLAVAGEYNRSSSYICTGSSDSSEDDLPSPRHFIKQSTKQNTQASSTKSSIHHPQQLDLAIQLEKLLLHDETKSDEATQSSKTKPSSPLPTRSHLSDLQSDKENCDGIIHYSPPRLYKPRRTHKSPQRTVTPPLNDPTNTSHTVSPPRPPTSPSKSRLHSPSKHKPHIPSLSVPQHLDEFWDADAINSWNDLHSPRKELRSPRKFPDRADKAPLLRTATSPSLTPTSRAPSPAKKPDASPTKRTRTQMAERKAFDEAKDEMAKTFLGQLDAMVTNSEIARLTASTGGVAIIWSKTLTKTAGRACWKRVRGTQPDISYSSGPTPGVDVHHASIELAIKVITSPYRLYNTVAHEFCHLASLMVSKCEGHPHGDNFKRWGDLCEMHFGQSHSINVTTKHSYAIEYKYAWQCDNCSLLYERHSKSLDSLANCCGRCRGPLTQIRPTPRGNTAFTWVPVGNTGTVRPARVQQLSGFAQFIKLHYHAVKHSLPSGTPHARVMGALAEEYRHAKAAQEEERKKVKAAETLLSMSPPVAASPPDRGPPVLQPLGDDGHAEPVGIEDDTCLVNDMDSAVSEIA